MSGKRDAQALPSKEAGLFRQVVRNYESKQYKKGIKAADAVLKKFPEHGETLSMKGLILNCQERKEEAFELARNGLRLHMQSYICWHVYGLLYRADRNYAEAIKCYKNALRLDKENLQVMKDLALLQIQIRDIPGFVETRQQLLQLRSSVKPHWVGFAIAHHLNGNHALAVQILDSFQDTQDAPDKNDQNEQYELSEVLMYKAMVLREGGNQLKALELLQSQKANIKDELGSEEEQARILLELGRLTEAEQIFRHILQFTPDNYKYHQGLKAAMKLQPDADGSLTETQREQLTQLYNGLQEQYPRSSAAKRIPLDFKVGQEFVDAADLYVRKFLNNGVPSLFSDLKPLYRHPEKGEALGKLFERLHASLQDTGDFPAVQGGDAIPAKPEAKVWTMFQLASHYDMQGRTGDALEMLQKCIEQFPELLELYTLQCKILKHAGDLEGAAAAADKARSMDLADRFVNSQAAKWQFRAGQIEQAEKTAAMFTKDGDQANNLHDMQCMWFEIENGRANLRRPDYGKALKMFHHTFKHFEDMGEDQFDFHTYCLRKMTLRSYVEMLRMEDSLLHHIHFSKAAWGAIETYLQLTEAPKRQAQTAAEEEAKLASMTPEERKKYKQKQKKEEQQRQKAAKAKEAKSLQDDAARQKENKDKGKKGPEGTKEKDSDPEGKQLAATKEPLAEATKLVQKLKQHAPDRLKTHLLAFEVYMLKGRLLLSLQAVKQALKLAGPSDPDVHRLVVRLCNAVHQQQQQQQQHQQPPSKATQEADGVAPNEVVQQVISSQVQQLLASQSPLEYNQSYMSNHASTSLRHTAAAAEMLHMLQPEQQQDAVKLLLDTSSLSEEPGTSGRATHADCVHVHTLLKDSFNNQDAANQWFGRCQDAFCWSQYFDGQKRIKVPTEAKANGVLEDKVSELSLNGHQ